MPELTRRRLVSGAALAAAAAALPPTVAGAAPRPRGEDVPTADIVVVAPVSPA